MQSFIAYCSLCLQLSNLINNNAEFLLKKDEACTLCLVDMFQPTEIDNFTSYNRSAHEIVNDGLYFNNPLLQEALKLKMEQQFLVQTGSCVGIDHQQTHDFDPFLKVTTQKEAEEALKPLVKRLQDFGKNKEKFRNELVGQIQQVIFEIKSRIKYTKYILDRANSEIPNKLKLPENLQHLFSLLDSYGAETLEEVIPKHLDSKMNGSSGKVWKDILEFSREVQKLNSKISQAQSSQEFSDIIQEINLVHNQTLNDLEQQYKLQYSLDDDLLFAMYPKTKEIIKQVGDYLKPIKTILRVGEKLTAHQRITSENSIFSLVMQAEGSLALYKYERVIWSSDKFEAPSGNSTELIFDPIDGILKIQDPDTESFKALNLKNPSYKSDGEAYLTITNAGEIKIIESGVEIWSPLYSLPEPKILPFESSLHKRDFIVSENEIYTFVLTDNCDIVLYEGSFPLWSRPTVYRESDKVDCNVQLDQNGRLKSSNLILIDPGKPLKGEPSLIVRNDGQVAIMDGDQEIYNE